MAAETFDVTARKAHQWTMVALVVAGFLLGNRVGPILLVDGGRPLHGRISVSGSKNASLPVMAASLLTTERVELANVPVVSDTAFLARIIRALGGSVDLDGDRATIEATTVGSEVPPDLGRRIRGSIVLLGAL